MTDLFFFFLKLLFIENTKKKKIKNRKIHGGILKIERQDYGLPSLRDAKSYRNHCNKKNKNLKVGHQIRQQIG